MHYSHFFDSVTFPDGRNAGDELRRRARKGSKNFTLTPRQMECIGLRILELEEALAASSSVWGSPPPVPDEPRDIRVRSLHRCGRASTVANYCSFCEES